LKELMHLPRKFLKILLEISQHLEVHSLYFLRMDRGSIAGMLGEKRSAREAVIGGGLWTESVVRAGKVLRYWMTRLEADIALRGDERLHEAQPAKFIMATKDQKIIESTKSMINRQLGRVFASSMSKF
jgi:hypothetical protein